MQGQTFPIWHSALRRYLAVIAIGNLEHFPVILVHSLRL